MSIFKYERKQSDNFEKKDIYWTIKGIGLNKNYLKANEQATEWHKRKPEI